MRIVGLTGGISSGKSTVSNLFKASGIPVVDADVVARDVLKKGSSGWKRVVAAFGEEILLPSREVDRPKIGQIVFSSDSKRQLLIPKLLLCLSRYRLMAPYISSGIFWEILKQWVSGAKVIVVDIPLLFERDGLSEEDARNRVMAQMLLDSKRSKADVVIDNNGSLDNLHQQFDNVLFEIRKPLTWIEFWRSRQGAFSVLGSVILGLSVCKQLKIGS
ncbi:unnamed protein product [Arabidopsis lyrata]|nr:unnamed protein product [Arabidopsis lyrata]